MPFAGQIIRALDFPDSVEIRQTASDTVNWDSYAATDPSCEGTFIAGTSGRGKLDLFVRVTTDGTEYIESSVEVREFDETGTIVHSPTEIDEGIDYFPATSLNQNADGWVYIDNLVPGRTYWVQMQHKTATGDDVNVLEQVVLWVPMM